LDEDSGLSALAKITEIDINEVGVDGAKNFFEAKVSTVAAVKNALHFPLYMHTMQILCRLMPSIQKSSFSLSARFLYSVGFSHKNM